MRRQPPARRRAIRPFAALRVSRFALAVVGLSGLLPAVGLRLSPNPPPATAAVLSVSPVETVIGQGTALVEDRLFQHHVPIGIAPRGSSGNRVTVTWQATPVVGDPADACTMRRTTSPR